MDEIFESAVRSACDLAGVFEYDGETSYFYLYAIAEIADHRVLDSIHVFSGEPDFIQADISIRWDSMEQKVGLFVKGLLWAVFDCRVSSKFGGGYSVGGKPTLPAGSDTGF